jgi:hypothetical protein
MKTIMQELVDIMNEDQVSFTEWFQDNYQILIEKEKEQIINAYKEGCGYEYEYIFNESKNSLEESVEYYNQTYNQNK